MLLYINDICSLILQPTQLTPLHQAVIKDKYELVLALINSVRLEQLPLPSPTQDNREQQIKSHCSEPGHSNYGTINKKNKVCTNEG